MAKDFKSMGSKIVQRYVTANEEAEQQPAAEQPADEIPQDVSQEPEKKQKRQPKKEPQGPDLLDCSAEDLGDRRRVSSQGRKGQQLPRRTVAFEPDLLKYTQDMAEKNCLTLSECVNDMIYFFKKVTKERE